MKRLLSKIVHNLPTPYIDNDPREAQSNPPQGSRAISQGLSIQHLEQNFLAFSKTLHAREVHLKRRETEVEARNIRILAQATRLARIEDALQFQHLEDEKEKLKRAKEIGARLVVEEAIVAKARETELKRREMELERRERELSRRQQRMPARLAGMSDGSEITHVAVEEAATKEVQSEENHGTASTYHTSDGCSAEVPISKDANISEAARIEQQRESERVHIAEERKNLAIEQRRSEEQLSEISQERKKLTQERENFAYERKKLQLLRGEGEAEATQKNMYTEEEMHLRALELAQEIVAKDVESLLGAAGKKLEKDRRQLQQDRARWVLEKGKVFQGGGEEEEEEEEGEEEEEEEEEEAVKMTSQHREEEEKKNKSRPSISSSLTPPGPSSSSSSSPSLFFTPPTQSYLTYLRNSAPTPALRVWKAKCQLAAQEIEKFHHLEKLVQEFLERLRMGKMLRALEVWRGIGTVVRGAVEEVVGEMMEEVEGEGYE